MPREVKEVKIGKVEGWALDAIAWPLCLGALAVIFGLGWLGKGLSCLGFRVWGINY
ncbi:MAG: hypothetical protein Q8N84_01135 [bacterium]|nr:hypothetical protein [bacterium]